MALTPSKFVVEPVGSNPNKDSNSLLPRTIEQVKDNFGRIVYWYQSTDYILNTKIP